MNRTALLRKLLLGALVTGLAPLIGAGVDAAEAGESPAALCRSTFGESGPVGGPVVGEGPSGDPMSTTIGWDPLDWSGGLREIVTCVSVGGRAAPALTASIPAPRNDGSLVIRLTLPAGEPGSVVCEQSVLLGTGGAAGRHPTTSPVCFKLRAGESPLGSGGPAASGVAAPAPAAPVGPPAPSPKAPVTATPPATYPASTPPARAAFEAARGGKGMAATRPGVPDPVAGVAVPAPAWPDPASPAPAAKPGQSTTVRAAAAPATGAAAAPANGTPAGAPVTTLARTGIDEHLPLASAGGFLALGGAAIIFSAPGRRRPRRRFV